MSSATYAPSLSAPGVTGYARHLSLSLSPVPGVTVGTYAGHSSKLIALSSSATPSLSPPPTVVTGWYAGHSSK